MRVFSAHWLEYQRIRSRWRTSRLDWLRGLRSSRQSTGRGFGSAVTVTSGVDLPNSSAERRSCSDPTFFSSRGTLPEFPTGIGRSSVFGRHLRSFGRLTQRRVSEAVRERRRAPRRCLKNNIIHRSSKYPYLHQYQCRRPGNHVESHSELMTVPWRCTRRTQSPTRAACSAAAGAASHGSA